MDDRSLKKRRRFDRCRQLRREGYYVDPNDLSALSPYLTEHIKRFGDYIIDLED
jgi:hypothetical protein